MSENPVEDLPPEEVPPKTDEEEKGCSPGCLIFAILGVTGLLAIASAHDRATKRATKTMAPTVSQKN